MNSSLRRKLIAHVPRLLELILMSPCIFIMKQQSFVLQYHPEQPLVAFIIFCELIEVSGGKFRVNRSYVPTNIAVKIKIVIGRFHIINY